MSYLRLRAVAQHGMETSPFSVARLSRMTGVAAELSSQARHCLASILSHSKMLTVGKIMFGIILTWQHQAGAEQCRARELSSAATPVTSLFKSSLPARLGWRSSSAKFRARHVHLAYRRCGLLIPGGKFFPDRRRSLISPSASSPSFLISVVHNAW